MKYLLTIYVDEAGWAEFTPEEQAESMKVWDEYTREATEAGVFVGGEGLAPSATATTVRHTDADPVISDGPYAETKEALGGYYLLDCENLDDAIEWAKKIPNTNGGVEVRPVIDYEARGSEEHSHEAAEASR